MNANSTKLRELERLYQQGRFLRAMAVVVFGALVVLWVVFPLDQRFLWVLVIDLLALGVISRLLGDYRERINALAHELKHRHSDSKV